MISPLDQAQENVGCVWVFGWERKRRRRGRDKREKKEKSGNANGNRKWKGEIGNNRGKEVYNLCVGELEINIGYVWELMIFINMGQNY